MQERRAAWVLASEPGGGVQVRTLSGTSTPCRRMQAAKAVTTLGGAVVGRVAFGAGAGLDASGAGPAEPPRTLDEGDGVAEPGAAEPGEGTPAEAGGGAGAAFPPPVSPSSPPQLAASARVAASSSAAGLVRRIGST